MSAHIIYTITFPDGSQYVGQTTNFQKRKNAHLRKFRLGAAVNARVRAKWVQFGEAVICAAASVLPGKDRFEVERDVYAAFSPELNYHLPKTRGVVLVVGGEELSIPEWADRCGVQANTIRYRLSRGWSPEQALGMAPSLRRTVQKERARAAAAWAAASEAKKVLFGGVRDSLRGHCRRLGKKYHTVYQRVRKGVPLEEAFS